MTKQQKQFYYKCSQTPVEACTTTSSLSLKLNPIIIIMAEVVLLGVWVSPFSTRVKIALAEKGIEFESKEEDLSNKSPLLLQMNPVHKKIPVLIHKGKPICESLIIIEYIDEVWNHKSPLLPSDPYERAHARFWADYADKNIFNIFRRLALTSDNEVKEAAAKEFIECFKVLEGELGDKPYFGGDTFGFVDVAIISVYSFFYTIETFGNFSMVELLPTIMAWAKRCMHKESVSKSLPDQYKVYEFVMQRRKKLGIE